MVNSERQLQDLIDKKKVIITETSIRSDLHLEDAGEETVQEGTEEGHSIYSRETQQMMTVVLDLEKEKDAQAKEIAGLKKREDASKQGRVVDETQGRSNDAEMFDIDDLHGDEVIMDMAVGEKQEKSAKVDQREIDEITPISAPTTVIDELTLAQTLIEIKAAKPKAVTTAAITTTIRPKARGVLEAKFIEEERLARKKEEEANIALIESWDNTQAMMEADFELAQRLQIKEQGEITIEERSRLFVELMNKTTKRFAMLRAEEKRRKPQTKA
ncbi:hypothetical protein Tco_1233173 [Tanacetum coccineum]